MKPFIINLFRAIGNFFTQLWKDGNIFFATLAFILKVLSLLVFIFMPQYRILAVIGFGLGWVIFYVAIIRWGYVCRNNKTKTSTKKANNQSTKRIAKRSLSKSKSGWSNIKK